MLEKSLGDQVVATGAEGGVAVIMEPGTGNILAMATYPTFDPNNPFATDDKSKRNTAVTDVFEPGSTSKVMTMASVIEEGGANPGTQYTIENRISRGGSSFKDYVDHPTLRLTLAGVLAKSSNIGTILASESIGEKKLYEYLKKFGIGQSTGMNFPVKAVASCLTLIMKTNGRLQLSQHWHLVKAYPLMPFKPLAFLQRLLMTGFGCCLD